ncbi:MAG TPA: hypothetical protein VHB47_03575 [Thermoanaerobaculia bacterium]|jgi:hypothetical protein|nr:hypothetical protein [Thermoanaerobaculia bacterium]
MIIFFLPLVAILLVYIIDVGILDREPRDRKGDQLTLPLEPSPTDLEPRDAALRSRTSS